MLNIVLAGVGGQGTVLAAKLLATAAQAKGWRVRTAETIGMAQRGGSVVSHVRMGNAGEEVYAPLVTPGTADMVVAFEPGEALRNISYLAPHGVVVSATKTVEPVSAALGASPYESEELLGSLRDALGDGRVFAIDDASVVAEAEVPRKVLNVVMLASAVATGLLPISRSELESAVESCVRSRFVEPNVAAIEAATRAFASAHLM